MAADGNRVIGLPRHGPRRRRLVLFPVVVLSCPVRLDLADGELRRYQRRQRPHHDLVAMELHRQQIVGTFQDSAPDTVSGSSLRPAPASGPPRSDTALPPLAVRVPDTATPSWSGPPAILPSDLNAMPTRGFDPRPR